MSPMPYRYSILRCLWANMTASACFAVGFLNPLRELPEQVSWQAGILVLVALYGLIAFCRALALPVMLAWRYFSEDWSRLPLWWGKEEEQLPGRPRAAGPVNLGIWVVLVLVPVLLVRCFRHHLLLPRPQLACLA